MTTMPMQDPMQSPMPNPYEPTMKDRLFAALLGTSQNPAGNILANRVNRRAQSQQWDVRQAEAAREEATARKAQQYGAVASYAQTLAGIEDPVRRAQVADQLLPDYADHITPELHARYKGMDVAALENLAMRTLGAKDRYSVLDTIADNARESMNTDSLVADRKADNAHQARVQDWVEQDALYQRENPELPTSVQEYEYAKGQGYNGTYADYETRLKQAGAPRTSINMPGQMTEGRKAVDKAYADDYIAWTQGGGSDNAKLASQLRGTIDQLESGGNVTGPALGLVPQNVRALYNPESVTAQQQVEEVVQRNLRTILGAQFTEKEGQQLIARAYNPQLSEAENARRVKSLLTQIETAAAAKESAARYFEQNGTLIGWKGHMPTMADFEQAVGGGAIATGGSGRVLTYDPATQEMK